MHQLDGHAQGRNGPPPQYVQSANGAASVGDVDLVDVDDRLLELVRDDTAALGLTRRTLVARLARKAGIPKRVRIFYIPIRNLITVKEIEPGTTYHAFYFDPRKGREFDLGAVATDENSKWRPPRPTIIQAFKWPGARRLSG